MLLAEEVEVHQYMYSLLDIEEVQEEMEEEVQVRMVLLYPVVIVHLLEVLKTLEVL